jgi:leucyl-tRNA synthetase
MSYGDGAVMGVPAHDERDFAFALKYGLAIRQVVAVASSVSCASGAVTPSPTPGSSSASEMSAPGAGLGAAALQAGGANATAGPALLAFDAGVWQDWYAEKGAGVAVQSGKYDGLGFKACLDAVAADLAALGLGEKKTTWRLRDWGVSRQRYWGTPIPIIHCDEHGAVPVPEKDLPVVLPLDCIPDGSGNPLHKHAGFHAGVTCPVCGKAARRETDTMDTFVDSSWYYMRYCDPANSDAMVAEGAAYWAPMDQYIGGIEHAILHLLYARFWTKVMRDLGLIKVDEPFTKLLTQGMVLNHIYSRRTDKGGKDYFWPQDVENVLAEDGKVMGARLKKAVGDLPMGTAIDYEGVGTMSKSKNNGVDPQDLIEKYGADTARLYTMFTAPPEATLEWNDAAVEGSYRFVRRVWNYAVKVESALKVGLGVDRSQSIGFSADAKKLRLEIHSVLRQANYDYERMQYNTVVSALMKMLNTLEDSPLSASQEVSDNVALAECYSILLRVMYPACPHLAFQLWNDLGYGASLGDLLDMAWPSVDETALQRDEIELMLQINGKLRGSLKVPANADKAFIEQAAGAHEQVTKQAAGAAPKKIIVVPGRLVNVVL